MPEITRDQIDALGQNTDMPAPELDSVVEVPVWEHPDAPAGSTSESLLVYERGVPVRVSGPTHYAHLTDGRVVASYGHGTHYTEAVPGGADRVTRIIEHFPG
jgi:hypothetical protein